MQLDFLEYKMDELGIAYEIVKTHKDNPIKLIVDGVPLDYERALKWIIERA